VQYLKVLGLRLRDHVVVVPNGVVVVNAILDSMVAFSLTVVADHVFPLVVIAFLKGDLVCLVLFLIFFQGK